jgi:hypothetical protein
VTEPTVRVAAGDRADVDEEVAQRLAHGGVEDLW